MIRSALPALVAAALTLSAPVATAQPENGDGRFSYHRGTDDGYWKLDGKTGQVSMCHRRPSGWQCQLVPDERVALEAEIARLQGENGALKKELLTRNIALPSGIRPDPPARNGNAKEPQRREEAEISRVMKLMESVWRRLVDMIVSVQRDLLKRT